MPWSYCEVAGDVPDMGTFTFTLSHLADAFVQSDVHKAIDPSLTQ